jgi:hypothetical protein
MSTYHRYLTNHQADALAALADGPLLHTPHHWISIDRPSAPVVRRQTVASLAERGLCRVTGLVGQETARVTAAGRRAHAANVAAHARVRSAA